MESNNIKKDAVAYDELVVTDSSGTLITGLTNDDFTRDLYNPDGDEVSSTVIVTVTELGGGKYRTNFTPNALGNWVVTIYSASYFPAGKSANYVCVTNLNDDLPGAVWDVNLNEHVSSSRSTGYRIKHISAASTTRIFNRGVWTEEEKKTLFRQIAEACAGLIIIKDKQEAVELAGPPENITNVITDVKNLVDGLQVVDRFKDLKDTLELTAQDNSGITDKLNIQIDDLKIKFATLLDAVNNLSAQQAELKTLSTKEDVEKMMDNIKLISNEEGKTESLLGEIYAYLKELSSLFVKTISTDKLETVVKGDKNE